MKKSEVVEKDDVRMQCVGCYARGGARELFRM